MSLVIVILVVVVILVILGIGVAAFWDAIVRGWNKLVQEAEGSEALAPTQQPSTRSSNNMSSITNRIMRVEVVNNLLVQERRYN